MVDGVIFSQSRLEQKMHSVDFDPHTRSGKVVVNLSVFPIEHFDNVQVTQAGLGFVPQADHPKFPLHQEAAQKARKLADRALTSGRWDLLVLDEVCFAVSAGLVSDSQVVDLLRQAGQDICIVLTGRGATPNMIDLDRSQDQGHYHYPSMEVLK